MTRYITVTGAYGRDYRNKKEALAAWEEGKDFQILDIGRDCGRYINKADAENPAFEPIAAVNIRFNQMAGLAVVKIKRGVR